jgi:glycosyltransferase involved in cell wall biosynthesis
LKKNWQVHMVSSGQKVLSVVIPCFNEEKTLKELISRVLQQESVAEVILVDDGSNDRSVSIAQGISDSRIIVKSKSKNEGKGSAIREGFQIASSPFVIIQDADLEYDPRDYPRILKPLIEGNADVVYGSRFLSSGERRAVYFWHRVGNNFLTLMSNMFTNIDLTDMETCYKAMKTSIAKQLVIKEQRFGLEPEMTARLARMELRIYEVPISYYGRTYEEGKKITWKDGFSALRCIVKYNLSRK